MSSRIAIAFGLLMLSAVPGFSQVLRLERDRAPEELDKVPCIDLSDASKFESAKVVPLEESKRASYYDRSGRPLFNSENPAKSDSIRSFTRYSNGSDYDSLPTNLADVIVSGRVISATPHIAKSGNSVYSTFQFASSTFLKGNMDGNLKPVTLTREGGVVLYPSGRKRIEGIWGEGIPVPGYDFLFFLKFLPELGTYKIINGYALSEPHVAPLDAPDSAFQTWTASDLLAHVRNKLSAK